MSDVWWGRGASAVPVTVPAPGGGARPRLGPVDPAEVKAELRDRIPSYTPEWTDLRREDAGVALVNLFGALAAPVLARSDLMPHKAFVELLRVAGVGPLAATPAGALLELAVADNAPAPVLVPSGFRAGAPPATGEGDLVTFETTEDVWAAPVTVAEVHRFDDGLYSEIALPEGTTGSFEPLGRIPKVGSAVLIGLAGGSAPGPRLSLGVFASPAEGSPRPATAGGTMPLPAEPPPVTRWEVLVAGAFEPAETVRDETAGLTGTGVVELEVPESWGPGRPAGLGDGDDRYWLRFRILHGLYRRAPRLAALRPNVVRGEAVRTVRGEVLEPVAGRGGARVMRVQQTPVLPGSLVIEVDEGAAGDAFGIGAGSGARRWSEVGDLASAGPEDRVFTLDPGSGQVTFGDGLNGARVPEGFRNVVALRYRVGGGSAGAVDADAVTTMLSSVPFVTGVTNPLPASGGADEEPRPRVERRGPQEIRARGRAVTPRDFELMALRSPGAEIARAHAVPGFHPAKPGRPIPGVVGVLVVPAPRGSGAPVPDEQALAAVAGSLARRFAPASAEVVVGAPRYHVVAVEAQVALDPAADFARVLRLIGDEIDRYLHPLTGGESGDGWPFGGTIRYVPLVQRILSRVRELRSILRLDVVLDGVRGAACEDRALEPHALLWPARHALVPESGGRA